MEKYIFNDAYDKTVSLDGKDIKCLSKKALKNLFPSGDYELIGTICPNRYAEEDNEQDKVLLANHEYELLDKRPLFNSIKGYIIVDNNKVVAIAKFNVLVIILPALIAAGVAGAILLQPTGSCEGCQITKPNDVVGDFDVGDKREEDVLEGDKEVLPETISFFGKPEYEINSHAISLELVNLPVNEGINMYFTVADDEGNTIASTSAVGAGQYAYVNVYDYFAASGSYNITISTYAETVNGTKLNGMVNEAVVNIVK